MTEVEPRWKEGPRPAKRPKGLANRSSRAIAREPERAACRAEVLARAEGRCQYAPLFPGTACGFYPPARAGLEVDELHGGGQRCIEQYDPDQCRAACPVHHDLKTADKLPTLVRLAEWEDRHR